MSTLSAVEPYAQAPSGLIANVVPGRYPEIVERPRIVPDWEPPSHEEIERRKGWRRIEQPQPLGTTEHEERNYLHWPKGLTEEFMQHHYPNLSGMEIMLYQHWAANYNDKKKYSYPPTEQTQHDYQLQRRHLSELRGALESEGLVERWSFQRGRRRWELIRLPHVDEKHLHRAFRQQPSAREILDVMSRNPIIFPESWIRTWNLVWLKDGATLLTPKEKLPDY